jgi:two-component system capsular synthesis sensor histidine kinase RcsC
MAQVKNILVVDDEPSIRALYQIAFSHSGFDVRVASSGEEALELLNEQSAEITFLDLNLPGIKGDKLCREILSKWPDTKMVAITGDLRGFGEQECKDAGFSHVLMKPIELKDLLEAANTD